MNNYDDLWGNSSKKRKQQSNYDDLWVNAKNKAIYNNRNTINSVYSEINNLGKEYNSLFGEGSKSTYSARKSFLDSLEDRKKNIRGKMSSSYMSYDDVDKIDKFLSGMNYENLNKYSNATEQERLNKERAERYSKMSVDDLNAEEDRLKNEVWKDRILGAFGLNFGEKKEDNLAKQNQRKEIKQEIQRRKFAEIDNLDPSVKRLLDDYTALDRQREDKTLEENVWNAYRQSSGLMPKFKEDEKTSQMEGLAVTLRNTLGDNWKEYVEYNRINNDKKIYEQQQEEIRKFATEHPVASSAITPITSMGKILGAMHTVADAVTDSNAPANPYTSHYAGNIVSNTIRDTVMENYDWRPNEGGRDWFDEIYSVGMSTADSVLASTLGAGLGGASIGVQAMSDAAQEVAENGGSKIDALLTGTIAGVNEALWESLSIGQFKKLQEVGMPNLFSKKGVKTLVGNILKSAGVNAAEEFNTETANIIADYLINGGSSKYAEAYQSALDSGLDKEEAKKTANKAMFSQMYEAGLGGALQGLLMGTAGSTFGGTAQAIENKLLKDDFYTAQGMDILAENGVPKLIEQARGITNERTLAKLENLAESVVEREKAMSDAQEMRYAKKVGKVFSNVVDTKLDQMGKENKAVVESLVREEVDKTDYQNKDKAVKVIMDSIENGTVLRKDRLVYDTVGGEGIKKRIANTEKFKAQEEKFKEQERKLAEIPNYNFESTEKIEDVSEFKTNEKGETYDEIGNKPIKIAKINEVSNEIVVETPEGETIGTDSLNLDKDTAVIFNGMKVLQKDNLVTPEIATEIYQGYDGSVPVDNYVQSAVETVQYGSIGDSRVLNNVRLPSKLKQSLYDAGKAHSGNLVEARQAIIDNAPKGEKRKGYVKYEVKKNKLNKMQKSQANLIESLADSLGMRVVLYESKVKDGKRQGASGWYDGNEIHVDIAAGNDGQGTMAFTLSHELTHLMREWNSKGFKTFSDALIQEYARNDIPLKKLIQEHIDNSKRAVAKGGRKEALTFDQAYEEVVAQACQSFLMDANANVVAEKMAQKDKGVWEKFKSLLKDFADKIRKALDSLKGMTPEGDESAYTTQLGKVNDLLELWQEGLLKALETQAVVASKATNQDKFQMRENVEETKDLIAVHNLSEEQLLRSLELGGFPMASIAILKAKQGHNLYGDISLVFDKATINPKLNKKNKVYGLDAWTPTFPKVEYKLNSKIINKLYKKANEMGNLPLFNSVDFYPQNFQQWFDNVPNEKSTKDIVDYFRYEYPLKQMFLAETSTPVKEMVVTKEKYELPEGNKNEYNYITEKMGKDAFAEAKTMSEQEWLEKYEEVITNSMLSYYKDNLKEKYNENLEETLLSRFNPYRTAKQISDFIDNDGYGIREFEDKIATQQKIDEKIDTEEYLGWLEDKLGSIVEKSGIRNQKDMYDSLGNERSWESLHYELNLENVVKAMLEKEQVGNSVMFSGLGIWGVSAKDYKSIEEIKADEDRLKKIPEEEYSKIKEDFGTRLSEIATALVDKNASNHFIAFDDAMSNIIDAVRTSKTKTGIYNYLQKYSTVPVTQTVVDDIYNLVSEIANMPTGYFEAKPQRVIWLEEVAYVVLPSGDSAELTEIKDKLNSMGIPYVEYEKENNEDRTEKLNSLGDVKFQDRVDADDRALIMQNITKVQEELKPISKAIDDLIFSEEYDKIYNSVKSGETDSGVVDALAEWSEKSGYNKLYQKEKKLKEKLNKLYEQYYSNGEIDNGNDSNIDGYDADDNKLSPSQIEYFKNSKVKNKNGNLIPLYHGSDNEFFTFDRKRLGKGNDQFGSGFYFGTSKDIADLYGDETYKVYLNIENPLKLKETLSESNPYERVKISKEQAYDILQAHPKMYDSEESPLGDWFEEYWDVGVKDWMIQELAEQNTKLSDIEYGLFRNYPNEFHEAVTKALGYDGVEVSFQGKDDKYYIAWNPNQIKNIDNKNPTSNDDIRYQDRAYLDAVESDDMDKAQAMVDDAAVKWGAMSQNGKPIKLYHGTQSFGFTKIDVGKSDDEISFFATDDLDVAKTYVNAKAKVKPIKGKANKLTDYTNEPQKLAQDMTSIMSPLDYVSYKALEKEGAFKVIQKLLLNKIQRIEEGIQEYNKNMEKAVYLFKNKDSKYYDEEHINLSISLLDSRLAKAIQDFKANQTKENIDKLSKSIKQDTFKKLLETIDERMRDRFEKIGNLYIIDDLIRIASLVNEETIISNNVHDVIIDALSLKDAEEKLLRGIESQKNKGIYSLYGKAENFLEVDAKGDNWNEIKYAENGETLNSTRKIAKYAKAHNYSGVIIKNVQDNGGRAGYAGPSDVYAFFYPETDVKSADAVTYDDEGNIIPLSKRFDDNEVDIRYQDRPIKPTLADVGIDFKEENEKLKADVDRLKDLLKLQKTETHGTVFTPTSVKSAASYLMKTFDMHRGKDELVKMLNDFYTYIAKGDFTWEDMMEEARKVANYIDNHATVRFQRQEFADEILRDIRDTKIKLSEEQKAEVASEYGSYEAFRKSMMGSAILSKDGLSLDDAWIDWANEYPWIFNKDTNPNDMPLALAEIIHDMRETNVLQEEYTGEAKTRHIAETVYDSYWRVSTLHTLADKQQKKVAELKAKHYNAMQELKENRDESLEKQKEKYQGMLKKVRETKDEQMETYKKKVKESRRKNVEGRQKTIVKHKIKKTAKELRKLLEHPTKEKNIKIAMQDFVKNALNLVDVISEEEENIPTETILQYAKAYSSDRQAELIEEYFESMQNFNSKKMAEIESDLGDLIESTKKMLNADAIDKFMVSLAKGYESLKNNEDFRDAYDSEVASYLNMVLDDVSGTKVPNMTLEQLKELYNAIKMVKQSVSLTNKIFKNNKAIAYAEYGNNGKTELKSANDGKIQRKAISVAANSYIMNNLTPYYYFNMLGSKTFMEAYTELIHAQNIFARDIEEAKTFIKDVEKKTNYNKWREQKPIKFSLESGEGLTLSLDEIFSLYAYSRREQAVKHLTEGGITFGVRDFEVDRKTGKIKQNKKVYYTPENAVKLTFQDITNIFSKLTEEQKEYVEKMQNYLSSVMGAKGNEVSRVLFGINLFNEDFYVPIVSSEEFLAKDKQKTDSAQASLKNAGMTKPITPNANNPIVLQGFRQVWGEHINDMSNYHAFVLPIENLNKLMGYVERETGESMKTVMKNRFGVNAEKYMNNFIRDLNGGKTVLGAKSPINYFGKFKKAAVGASASVVVQQPTAILRAMALIKPKYFVGKTDLKLLSKKYDELKKYAPIAIIKEMGGFDVGNSNRATDYMLSKDYSNKEKLKAFFKDEKFRDDKLMSGAEKADELGWVMIWEAVQREVADKSKYQKGTEEFYEACGERFTEIIAKTQVYDSVLSRSGYMRSQSEFVKMATAFMGEPTVSSNILFDSVLQLKNKKISKAQAVANISAVFASIIGAAAMKSFIYALRDDDDEESYIDKYIQAVTSSLAGDLFIPNMLPFIRDIVSIFDGWDVERTDVALFKDLKDAIDGIDSEKKSPYRKIEDLIGTFAHFFGVPAKNLMRTFREMYNAVINIIDDNIPDKESIEKTLKESGIEALPSIVQKQLKPKTKADYTRKYKQKYIDAYHKGDKDETYKIRKILQDSGLYDDVAKTCRDWLKDGKPTDNALL